MSNTQQIIVDTVISSDYTNENVTIEDFFLK